MLNKKVLVLNKSWSPIAVISLKKAIVLLFSEVITEEQICEPKAKIVTPDYQMYTWDEWALLTTDGEDCIHSGRQNFKIPEIIILTQYNKIPSKKGSFSRKTMYHRDGGICQYCGIKLSPSSGTIDHVVPRSQNGGTTWENTVLCCSTCNRQKADRIPEKATREGLPKEKRKNWRGPSPMKLLNIPKKPTFTIFDEYKDKYISWKAFLG